MTTRIPASMLAAGAAVGNLGFTPVANTLAAILAVMGYTPANKAGETFTGPTSHKALHTPPTVVAFSATAMAVDCALSNIFTTTLTANVTTAPAFSNLKDGQTVNWFLTQDATGSRTMTWPTSFKWPGGTAGVLSTAANSVDMVEATYRAATGFWYVTLLKDFK